ncbi:MAG: alanine racemase [Candidatus Puniceispirillum sp.]|nr:alanine racemase [Candidatus Puniceispirillum sp.]
MPSTECLPMIQESLDTTCEVRVDLSAVRHNFRVIQEKIGPTRRALAVVKAGAYGLGLAPVARALRLAGCRHFVVAFPEEAFALRALLKDVDIYVLSGAFEGMERQFLAQNLIPVLNDEESLLRWQNVGGSAPCAIHIDTGMARTGLEPKDFERLLDVIQCLNTVCLMSHFAASDLADHPFNETQRARFEALCALMPHVSTCFANSCGLTLGSAFWGDFVRPGLSLYGLAPENAAEYGLRSALQVRARLIQVRTIDAGQSVGYAMTWQAQRPSRIATVAMGYADGLPRDLGNKGCMWLDGQEVPIIGRVSMDFTTLDLTDLPPVQGRVGDWVDLFYDGVTLSRQAQAAGTAPHTFLVGLGPRCARVYEG